MISNRRTGIANIFRFKNASVTFLNQHVSITSVSAACVSSPFKLS